MKKIRIVAITAVALLTLFTPLSLQRSEFPEFRVVIDPGHGGIAGKDRRRYGDRYDRISKTYLQDFREGASYRNLEEHALVYSIAAKTLALLELCSPGGDYGKFEKILDRYADNTPRRIYIIPFMSREDSRDREKIKNRADPNAEFRIFDYPGRFGSIKKGRISYINSLRPQLVVSLHITFKDSSYYRGMNPVIAPPYDFLHKGFEYLKGEIKDRKFFNESPYSDWFVESNGRSGFFWYLSDASLYFTGYPLKRDLTINHKDFRGYRYNMVHWKYADLRGWETRARHHPSGTAYASSIKDFKISGNFFQREGSEFERYRRDGGIEGYGGDNLYASREIIRYILLALNMRGLKHPDQRLGPPFISVWHVPLLVNAVNAFLELGYLSRRHFRYLLTQKQDEIAEGIAVGIYSLFAEISPLRRDFRYAPKGKRIDLEKYRLKNNRSYFDVVAHD